MRSNLQEPLNDYTLIPRVNSNNQTILQYDRTANISLRLNIEFEILRIYYKNILGITKPYIPYNFK